MMAGLHLLPERLGPLALHHLLALLLHGLTLADVLSLVLGLAPVLASCHALALGLGLFFLGG